jgi:hypothetical protein
LHGAATDTTGVDWQTAQNKLIDSVAVALKKDSDDDYRACIKLVLNSNTWTTPPASGTFPDPPTDINNDPDAQKCQTHWQARAFTIVNSFGIVDGLTNSIPGSAFILNWSSHSVETCVHEWGHVKGLDHFESGVAGNATNRMNIMRSGDRLKNQANCLTSLLARSLDDGP